MKDCTNLREYFSLVPCSWSKRYCFASTRKVTFRLQRGVSNSIVIANYVITNNAKTPVRQQT